MVDKVESELAALEDLLFAARATSAQESGMSASPIPPLPFRLPENFFHYRSEEANFPRIYRGTQ